MSFIVLLFILDKIIKISFVCILIILNIIQLCPESDVEDDIAFSFGTHFEKAVSMKHSE